VGSNPTGHPKEEVERLPFFVSGGMRTHGFVIAIPFKKVQYFSEKEKVSGISSLFFS
jgi:hypothetical protein